MKTNKKDKFNKLKNNIGIAASKIRSVNYQVSPVKNNLEVIDTSSYQQAIEENIKEYEENKQDVKDEVVQDTKTNLSSSMQRSALYW